MPRTDRNKQIAGLYAEGKTIDEIADIVLKGGHGHFEAMTAGRLNQAEIIAALISDKDDLIEGIRYAQEVIDGSASIMVLKEGGDIYLFATTLADGSKVLVKTRKA